MKVRSLKKRIFFVITVFILAEGIGVNDARAQQDAKSRARRGGNGIKFLRIKNNQNALTFNTEYEKEEQELAASSAAARRSRLMFREILEANFKGSVYHPKFMDFDLFLEIAPQQDKEKSDTTTNSGGLSGSYLSHYRLNSYFLKEKPFHFNLFTDKQREVQNRDFFERQVIDSISRGGRFAFKNKLAPLYFLYSSTEKDIDRSFRSDQSFDDETVSLQIEPDFVPWGESGLDYTRNRFLRTEAGTEDQKGISEQIFLSNHHSWDEERPRDLSTSLRYFSLENSRDSRSLTFDEALSIEHNDDLRTSYRYNFADNSVEEIDSTENNLSWGLTHQLYESLRSSWGVSGIALKTTSFDETEVGANIDEDYTKEIGAARLGLGVGYLYERKNRENTSALLNVANESHVLDDAAVVFLNHLGIDTATVAVTNSAGTSTYIKDADYQIIEHTSGFFEIKRVLTGSIANGDTVLVDYIVQQNPSFQFATAQNRYRVSLGVWEETVQFYLNYRQQRHTELEGASNLLLERFDDTIYGGKLDLGWAAVNAEYEDYDSDLNPYTALRFREDFSWNLSVRSILTLRVAQDYVSLIDDERQSWEARALYSMRLNSMSVYGFEAGYRRQKGETTDLQDLVSRMTYKVNVGQLSFESGYEFQKEFSLGSDRKNHYIFTNLKRIF